MANLSDTDLQAFLNLSDSEMKKLLTTLQPDRRAVYERMFEVTNLIDAGKIPEGVIVCKSRCRHG